MSITEETDDWWLSDIPVGKSIMDEIEDMCAAFRAGDHEKALRIAPIDRINSPTWCGMNLLQYALISGAPLPIIRQILTEFPDTVRHPSTLYIAIGRDDIPVEIVVALIVAHPPAFKKFCGPGGLFQGGPTCSVEMIREEIEKATTDEDLLLFIHAEMI